MDGVSISVDEGEFVAVVGTSMTSIARQFVESDTIATFSVWDPAEAGKAMIEMAIAEYAQAAALGVLSPEEAIDEMIVYVQDNLVD